MLKESSFIARSKQKEHTYLFIGVFFYVPFVGRIINLRPWLKKKQDYSFLSRKYT